VQLVRSRCAAQVLQLRHERRDANAAGNQQVLARKLIERKQVDRVRNLKLAAHLHLIVHEMRAAARLLHAPHTDLVAIELRRRTHQRVRIAMHPMGAVHDHDDMRAARERRQRAAGGAH